MQEGFVNFNSGNNFDPNTLAQNTSTVIMFLVINDVSPSIRNYASAMNTIAKDTFIGNLKNSHRKGDIVVKAITFCDDVKHVSGFMPILNVPDDYFDVQPQGTGTALYEAVYEGLKHAIQYREDLEAQGIEVRTAIFISTDGDDNESDGSYEKNVRKMVDDLRSNEAWASSFTINMLGVGRDSIFRQSCKDMGLDPDKCLITVSNSPDEIRKQMGVVSQSVTSSANAGVNF